MFKWMFRIVGLGFMFIILGNYSSCTRQEVLIPQKAVQDVSDVINYIHKGVWWSSDKFTKMTKGQTFKEFVDGQPVERISN